MNVNTTKKIMSVNIINLINQHIGVKFSRNSNKIYDSHMYVFNGIFYDCRDGYLNMNGKRINNVWHNVSTLFGKGNNLYVSSNTIMYLYKILENGHVAYVEMKDCSEDIGSEGFIIGNNGEIYSKLSYFIRCSSGNVKFKYMYYHDILTDKFLVRINSIDKTLIVFNIFTQKQYYIKYKFYCKCIMNNVIDMDGKYLYIKEN